jgi:uroporphyrin-3 C-methyltransferase
LERVRRDDLQGIYLRLEAVKTQIDVLPIVTPQLEVAVQADTGEKTVWQVLADEFRQLVRIRTLDASESIKPLLAPQEQRYLELNLRLSLEQAQLATLKRQQGVYDHSLQQVNAWLHAYADAEDERTQAALDALRELLVIDLARVLPDISGSLSALSALRRNGQ